MAIDSLYCITKFVICWDRRKCAITCLQNRDYSSSAPVRYIPKNSSKVKKLESSPQKKGSEEKEFREFPEVKQSGRRVRKSLDFNEKPQNQNQNRYSNSSFSDAQKGILFFNSSENKKIRCVTSRHRCMIASIHALSPGNCSCFFSCHVLFGICLCNKLKQFS